MGAPNHGSPAYGPIRAPHDSTAPRNSSFQPFRVLSRPSVNQISCVRPTAPASRLLSLAATSLRVGSAVCPRFPVFPHPIPPKLPKTDAKLHKCTVKDNTLRPRASESTSGQITGLEQGETRLGKKRGVCESVRVRRGSPLAACLSFCAWRSTARLGEW